MMLFFYILIFIQLFNILEVFAEKVKKDSFMIYRSNYYDQNYKFSDLPIGYGFINNYSQNFIDNLKKRISYYLAIKCITLHNLAAL